MRVEVRACRVAQVHAFARAHLHMHMRMGMIARMHTCVQACGHWCTKGRWEKRHRALTVDATDQDANKRREYLCETVATPIMQHVLNKLGVCSLEWLVGLVNRHTVIRQLNLVPHHSRRAAMSLGSHQVTRCCAGKSNNRGVPTKTEPHRRPLSEWVVVGVG